MRCPKCGTENLTQARFCLTCGEKLVEVCPQCGKNLPAEAKFCLECGARVATPETVQLGGSAALTQAVLRQIPKEYAERLLATRGQPHDERRTVTILFSDIKGSTAMIEKLDPEDAKEIIQGAFEFLIGPIFRYEGTLVQLMGDAILAFFGAPIAHEDDPERACRAALDITAEAAEYAERLEKERRIEGFGVRVGINTGLVVVGEVGWDLRVAYTAIGDAINLAARMEQNAAPGTVLTTEATHKLVAPLFEMQAMPPLAVKGKDEPVLTYRVLAAKAMAGKVRGIAGLESPLVGREGEYAALQEAVERLKAGVGGIVTIVGEAGLGKSRLVAEVRRCHREAQGCHPERSEGSGLSGEEILRFAQNDKRGFAQNDKADSVHWVEGRCLSYGTAVPYLLWLDVLRGLLGVTVEDSPEAVRQVLQERVEGLCRDEFDHVYPYLARLLSLPLEKEITAKLDDLDGQELKASTWQAVQKLIGCTATERPMVLVCEDLHWADAASLELLEQLLALSDRTALLFILVFRPEPEHGSWRLREVAAGRHLNRFTDLRLQPLSANESGILVTNLLRVEQLPPALKGRILSTAEGNPFYVEEIIRSLMDQGAIVHDEETSHWRATASAVDVAIPDTLQGLLVARIDRLQEDTKRVLQMASVIGRFFLYRVLEAIAHEERRLDEHLTTLQRQEMIRERARIPELEYVFKHELTREAAYNGLLKKERRTFHRQVAEALEQLFPERIEEQLGLLAHHWERAGDAEKATAYLLRAGDQARLAYAHQEAADCYRRALAFLQKEGQCESAARTWMKLGLTYLGAGDLHRSQQAYEQGFAAWQRAEESLRLSSLALAPAAHPFRLALTPPRTLDPVEAARMGTWGVIPLLFSALVEMGPRGDVLPDAAQSWDVLEGGRSYVFHLRDDLRWSDGVPIAAADFEYALRCSLDPNRGDGSAGLLYDIMRAEAFQCGQLPDWSAVGVKCMDERTLAFTLERPAGYFLQLLPLLTYPLPRHVVDAWGGQWTAPAHLVTNGPFRLRSYEPGKRIMFVRNPDYRGLFSGNVEQLEMHLMADPAACSAVLASYAADELDVAPLSGLSARERQRALERYADDYVSWWIPGIYTLLLAASREPFADRRVRQALAFAVDRQVLGGLLGPRASAPASGGLVPAGMPGHSAGIALPCDPDRARALLAEAGFAGGRGFPTIEGMVWQQLEPWANHLQAQWQESLGIRVRWQILPFTSFTELLPRGAWQVAFCGFQADYYDPDNFLRTNRLRKLSGWQHDGYEQLVAKARETLDQAERMALYQEADRILVQEAAIVPLTYLRAEVLCKPWVKYPVASGHLFWPPWKEFVIVPH